VRPGRARSELALDGVPRIELIQLGDAVFDRSAKTEDWRTRLRFLFVDPFERLLFVEPDTGVLRALDRDGRLLFEARPDETDLGKGMASRLPLWTAVGAEGRILVREVSGLVDFTNRGERVGRSGEPSYSAPQMLFLPHSAERWEVDRFHGKITRLGPDGEVLSTIERGAHGRWLRHIEHPVVAANGTLALLDHDHDDDPGDVWLHAFDRDGLALGSLELPSRGSWSLAFDGERAALLRERELLLVAPDGTIRARATLSESEPYPITFAPDGELWVFEGSSMRRYRVP